MEQLHIGIIGCGRIADVHYLGYENNPEARVYAVCDVNRDIAEARRQQWNAVKCYTDFHDLLRDKEVDAVEILTPHDLHETMVMEAVRAKKHVAVQKPMTVSINSANRMIAEAHKAGVVYKVTENYVFYPPFVLAKQMIESGEIGEPTGIRIKYIGGSSGGWQVPSTAWEWRMKEAHAGRGITTFDHGHHLWSTAWFLLGEIERVWARIDSADGIVDCPSVFVWKYKGRKVYGVCDLCYAADMHVPSKYYANDEWVEVTGSRGIIFVHRCTGNIHEGPTVSVFKGHSMEHVAELRSDWGDGFVGATNNFIDAIKGRKPALLSGEQGREIMKYALAAAKSAQVSREVYPDEIEKNLPSIYAWRRKRRERRTASAWRTIFSWFSDNSSYAPQAGALTKALMGRFQPEAAANWEAVVGICLGADGTVPEQKFALTIMHGKAELKADHWPEGATLTLQVPAGTWAAILLGKERLETAFLLGKIKLQGRAEEALKLRAAFRI